MIISKEFKAGIISIVAIASFWWLFNYLKGNDLFSSTKTYYANFDNVDGLAASKSVMINGLKVGMIKSILPISNGKGNYTFEVQLEVDDAYTFSKNSIAEVYESGLLSGKDIRIVLAKEGSIAKDGDFIKGKISGSLLQNLSNEILPLKDNANKVLIELDATLKQSQKLLNDGNIEQVKLLIENLNATVSGFKQTSDGLNGLITNNDKKISNLMDNANSMVSTTKTTVEKYGKVADNLNKIELDKTVAKLQTTLDNLNNVMEKVNKGEGSLGKLINDKQLYDNLNKSSANLAILLEDFKKNPKNYIHFSIFGKKNQPTEVQPINP